MILHLQNHKTLYFFDAKHFKYICYYAIKWYLFEGFELILFLRISEFPVTVYCDYKNPELIYSKIINV